MRSRAVLCVIVLAALPALSCDFVTIGSLRKQVRAPIAPFAVKSAPFGLLTSRKAFKSLLERYPLPASVACRTAVSAFLASCDITNPCDFDVLERTLRAECGTTLATGDGDPGGPRFQTWVRDTVADLLARSDSHDDPHEGTFEYDLSSYLGAPIDFDAIDASTRSMIASVPVRLELRRTYATPKDLLGREAAPVAELISMPELRAAVVTELDLRTMRPDEPGLTTSNSTLLDASRLDGCIDGQPSFGGLVDMTVRVASLAPADSALTAPLDEALSEAGEILVEATIPPGSSEVCSIAATSRDPVNVAPYLAAQSREIDVRIEIHTPLPMAVDDTCADGCEATMAYVGGFAWLDVSFEDLDARSLAAVVSAFRHEPPSAAHDAGTD